MSKNLLCPLSFNNVGNAGFIHCAGENCAFWIESKKCCSIKFIACMMSPLHDILNKLEKSKDKFSPPLNPFA